MPTNTQVRRPASITTISGGSSIAWTSASNALGDDGLYATCQSAAVGPVQSYWLMMTVCGFSIPSDASSLSLYYSCRRKCSAESRVNTEPYTIESGSVAQSLGSLGHWTTSDATETTVFPLTTGLSYSLLNATDFGLAIRVTFDGGDGVTPVIAYIDDAYLTVTYDSDVVPTALSGLSGIRSYLDGAAGVRPLLSGRVGLKKCLE